MRHPYHITRFDERWKESCPRLVELVSAAVDPSKAGIGSSPWLGDISNTGVTVLPLAAAQLTPVNRQLFRLCSVDIPSGGQVRIRGLRTLVTIGQEFPVSEEAPAGTFVFEREVVSPLWSFQDGNVSWHVRHEPNMFSTWEVADAAQTGGTSPMLSGEDSALLYVPPFAVYVAPGSGIPPGGDADYLGTWRDQRYPWTNTDWDLAVPVFGPGRVTMYASVLQTNPSTRVALPQLTPPAPFTDPVTCGMRPEDQFLLQFPSAVYRRVAGAMLVEVFPCCGPQQEVSTNCVTCGGANCERHR